MHGCAVIPENDVADSPAMAVHRRLDVRPDFVQQAFGILERETRDVGIAAPPEIESAIARYRVLDDDRVRGADARARIVGSLKSLADIAAGVISPIVLDVQVPKALD